ncbi:MAG: nucleotide exchange factor GrpE [Treponema sp.]|nr:nucleotide exchange factor GrpE [Treponema sp.]
MAFYNFLRNSAKNIADLTAQKVDASMSVRLSGHFLEINERLKKIETRQKETNLQIEEIDSHLQSDGDETVFVNALISLADIIGDFYYFASEDKDSPLFEQAQMMWNTAKNKAETVGLSIIDAADEPFDANIHSIKDTEWDDNLPTGFVVKTLKCGFIFKDAVIRRAAVIINKQEIIYL